MLEPVEQLQLAPAREDPVLWWAVVILVVLAVAGMVFWSLWGTATVRVMSDTGALYLFICH